MASRFEKAFATLIGYCKAKGKWEVDIQDPPYSALLSLASQYYGATWSFEQFDVLLNHHLGTLKTNLLGKGAVSGIINNIQAELQRNMQDVFLIVPLKGAWISSTVVIGDIAIVRTSSGSMWTPKSLPQIDIEAEVASITGMGKIKISSAFSKITHSRAKDFLTGPLLVVKRHGQYDVIAENRRFILKYINLFIRLLANHNKANSNSKYLGWINADHFFSIDQNNNYHHYPLVNVIALNYDLSFLTIPDNQVILSKIMAIFDSRSTNELQIIYFRAMKFYNIGSHGGENSIDAISQRLLNTLIAAETLLSFSTRGEKKSKLAHVMIGLNSIPDHQKEQYYKAVIEAYTDRSYLVHAGKQDVDKYMIDRETDKRESESLIILSELMSFILTKFPDWYTEITSRESPDNYLVKWQQKVKSYVPVFKYNIFQKIVSKIIVFLQKAARLKSDG